MIDEKQIQITTKGRGLYPITDAICQAVKLPKRGLLNCFLQHTSASLLIQENYDPTARADIEKFLCRLIPDSDSWYTHTLEGKDDSTSHLKSTLTPTSLTIPIRNSQLALGRWQGIYLFEHRISGHNRTVLITVYGE